MQDFAFGVYVAFAYKYKYKYGVFNFPRWPARNSSPISLTCSAQTGRGVRLFSFQQVPQALPQGWNDRRVNVITLPFSAKVTNAWSYTSTKPTLLDGTFIQQTDKRKFYSGAALFASRYRSDCVKVKLTVGLCVREPVMYVCSIYPWCNVTLQI